MIIFLYGEDEYRLKQETSSVIQKYKNKYPNGLNLFGFDLASDDVKNLEDAIKTSSFFNDVKLIVVKNSFLEKENTENIHQLVKNYDIKNDKLTVVLFSELLPEKDLKAKDGKLFTLLSDKNNLVRNFEKLDGIKLENWLKKEFSLRNCSISTLSAKKLIQAVNKDISRLSAEIDKLSNYRLKGEITPSDIDSLVNRDVELSIFHLIDAIAAKDKVRALGLLYQELQTGRDLYYILTMITYQMRNMLIIKDLASRNLSAQEIANKSKLHPFVIKKSLGFLRNLSIDESRDYFNLSCQADRLIKDGRMDIQDFLYNFILTAHKKY